jgi:RNA polymerase sigma-70 factor (ECF subfamily)
MRAMHTRSARSSLGNTKSPQSGEAETQSRTPDAVYPEGDVITAAQGGDRAALDQLLAAARPRMVALALRVLGDVDEAEDAVQEAMVKVWRNVGRFEGRASLNTWLHRIAVNAALDRIRRRSAVSTPARLDADEERSAREEAVVDETPEQSYARAQVGVVVQRALRRLSPIHGEAIRLCDIDGESYATIATVTDCPVGTVMSRLYHARRKLVRELTTSATSELDLTALCAA